MRDPQIDSTDMTHVKTAYVIPSATVTCCGVSLLSNLEYSEAKALISIVCEDRKTCKW